MFRASENQLTKPDTDLNESSNKDMAQKSEKKSSGDTVAAVDASQEGLEKIVEEDETNGVKVHGAAGATALNASTSAMSKLSSSQRSFSTGVEPKTPTLKVFLLLFQW